jgi:hypothetical protein
MRFGGSVVPSIICRRTARQRLRNWGDRCGEKSRGNRMGCAQGAAALDPGTAAELRLHVPISGCASWRLPIQLSQRNSR